MTAVLVEVCFVDGRADEAAYNTVGPAAIACAIADAVVGGSVGTTPAPVKPAPPPRRRATMSGSRQKTG